MSMREIADKFGVSKSTIRLIIKGKNWKEISLLYDLNR